MNNKDYLDSKFESLIIEIYNRRSYVFATTQRRPTRIYLGRNLMSLIRQQSNSKYYMKENKQILGLDVYEVNEDYHIYVC